MLSHFSRIRLPATPWTMAHQAPLSLRLSRQEHWSVLPFPSPVIKYEVSELKSLRRVRLCDSMDCSLPGSSIHGIFPSTNFSPTWLGHHLCSELVSLQAFLWKASPMAVPRSLRGPRQTLFLPYSGQSSSSHLHQASSSSAAKLVRAVAKQGSLTPAEPLAGDTPPHAASSPSSA